MSGTATTDEEIDQLLELLRKTNLNSNASINDLQQLSKLIRIAQSKIETSAQVK